MLRKFKYVAATAGFSVVILLLLGELMARLLGVTVVYEYDADLGWRPKRNFAAQIPVTDQSGDRHLADYSTGPFGFRSFGNLEGKQPRILFVGDSWTGDPNTSDAEAYFSVVGDNLPAEIFAIGAGGYGTLQELMLVREYAERIRPDVLVLQFCDNDIINNSLELEGPRITRNQKNFRPYRVAGQTRYRLSAASPYNLLHRGSRLFRTLDALLAAAQYQLYDGYYPPPFRGYDGFEPAQSPQLQAEVDSHRRDAIATTRALLQEMKQALPAETQTVTFAASSDDVKELQIWQELAAATGFRAYPSVSMQVEAAEVDGRVVRVKDGAHWNRLGNRLAGEELARLLARDFFPDGL